MIGDGSDEVGHVDRLTPLAFADALRFPCPLGKEALSRLGDEEAGVARDFGHLQLMALGLGVGANGRVVDGVVGEVVGGVVGGVVGAGGCSGVFGRAAS